MDAQNQTKLDARRSEFEELKERIDELPEVVIDLGPGEIYFPAIYQPATFAGAPEMQSWYGITIPALSVLTKVDSQTASWLVRNVRHSLGPCPFERLRLKSKHRPEVYVMGMNGEENYPADMASVHAELIALDIRNCPRDYLFISRKVRVHAKLYAYWFNKFHFDRQGIGISLRKIGVWS